MTIFLRVNTASQEVPLGYFVDSTDGNTEETGLTIANTDIKLWKSGATSLVNKNSGGATHMANGIYYAVLDATDTNTAGPLIIYVHVTGALTVKIECCVLIPNVYDSLIYGADMLDVSLVQWLGTAPNALTSSRVDVSVGAMASGVVTAAAVATGAIDADALATDAVTEIQSGLATASALATVDDFIDTEVAAILAAVDTEVGAIKAKTDNLPASPAATGDIPSAATIAAAVWDEPLAEPAGIFNWATTRATFRDLLQWLGAMARNKTTLNSGTGVQAVRNDADNANLATSTTSDDGTTFTRGEYS